MVTIPTTQELDVAAQSNVPPYAIQLPEWAELINNNLPDNVPAEPTYTPGKHALNCSVSLKNRIDLLKKKYPSKLGDIDSNRPNESGPNSDTGAPLEQVPHPDSDVSHVDPGQAGGPFRGDFSNMMAQFRVLEGHARGDGELADKFSRARTSLVEVENLLVTTGKGPQGMQRLRLIFQWTLCQVTTVFGEINAALDNKSQNAYTAARQAYMELMRDLDDSEPQTGSKPPMAGISGYGKVIKWSYILPLIHGGRIKGTKVMAKWNPHVSSSGIPIPHS